MQNDSQKIVVGRISGIYGVKGWLKVMSYTRPRDNIFEYKNWWLGQNDDWQEIDFLEGQAQGKGLIARLAGIEDREQARALIDADIAVSRSQLGRTSQGEFYWHDLIGLEVCNQQNEILGQVKELIETGANDVLVVEGKSRILIPFVKEHYILDIDLENNMIRVDWDTGEE